MHLVIYFCGTGNPGDTFAAGNQYLQNNNDIRTLFVRGCDDPNVCNSTLFPDLKAFAKRFSSTLFGKTSKLKTTNPRILRNIGIRPDRSTIAAGDQKDKIASITLCGYSRGAVTCFEVARQLNTIAPNIPVDVVADQPVPGNLYQIPGSNAASVADCSDLKNLRNVSVILGSYTGATTFVDLHFKLAMPDNLERYKTSYLIINGTLFYIDEQQQAQTIPFNPAYNPLHVFRHYNIKPDVEGSYHVSSIHLTEHFAPAAQRETTNLIHRGFFSQILPKLPRSAHRDLIVIPRESHHENRMNAPSGEEHMHMQIANYLSKKGLVPLEVVENQTNRARNTYSVMGHIPPNPYPQLNQLQQFFGLSKKEAYRYLDKLNPTAKLRKGMMFTANELLIQWWSRHDRKASYFSTQLTKELVKTIKSTDRNDPDQLKILLQQSDRWLVEKEHRSTSRYAQVECLRNNIHHELVTQHHIPKQELAQLNRECLHKTDYFLKHWTLASRAASWFKTDQTRTLDQAFAEHAKAQPHSEEGDRTLMNAMDKWLQAKKNSNSKRYDLVVAMREHLEEVVENTYANQATFSPR